MSSVTSHGRNGAASIKAARQEKVFVTPEMASEWLAYNDGNRRLIVNHVAALAAVLSRGEWTLNGATVKFSSSGRLLDGQHRLTACVQAGVGFWTYVVYGLDDSAFDTIDTTVAPRKASDILSIYGKTNAHHLAAAVKSLWVFSQTGQFYDGGGGAVGCSPRVICEVLARRPAIEHYVKATHNNRVFSSQRVLASLCYLFACVDESLSGEFLSVVTEGSGDISRPFNILRETLINRRMCRVRVGNRPLAFMTIRAWNSELSGVWLKKLYYKPNEEFPQIKGLDYAKLHDYV